MKQRALVTGSLGHIGSELVKELKLVYDVMEIDIRDSSSSKQQSFDMSDAVNPKWELVKLWNPIVVFHLAGLIKVDESERNPMKYYRHNVCSTINLLSVLESTQCKRIVFASTAAIYKSSNHPIKETDEINPESIYGKTKWMIESIIEDFCCKHNVSAVSLRFFNVAGYTPREELFHLIPILVDRVKNNKEISLYGTNYQTKDGTCIRDYIHVEDLVQAMIKADNYMSESRLSMNIPINIGSGIGYSVREVIRMVLSTLNSNNEVIELPNRPGDPPILISDISKAKDLLNWIPTKSLKDMVCDTIHKMN